MTTMVTQASNIVVMTAFRIRFDEVKADIKAGRITFKNSPPEWTEKMLNITALNYVMLLLAEEARWN